MDKTLRIWESTFEDALSVWRAAYERRELLPLVTALFEEHVLVGPVLVAIRDDASLSAEQRRLATQMARSRGKLTDYQARVHAWPLVDPLRADEDTDVDLGLRLARVGVEFAPEEHRIRDTHAWALFANGLHDEALVESARALELAPEDEKDDYQGYLDRMRAMIEAAQAPASDDD